MKEMKYYPCEINPNDTFVTKDGRVWTVDHFDGRYVYTKEGQQFKPNHPDILYYEDAPVVEQQSKKASTKKKIAEKVIEEEE